MSIPVTSRATWPTTRIAVVPSFGATRARHIVSVPRGACPVSGNPILGVAVIEYTPRASTIEVVALRSAIAWAASGADDAPRSVEELATWIASESALATGTSVAVTLHLIIRPGPQILTVRAGS